MTDPTDAAALLAAGGGLYLLDRLVGRVRRPARPAPDYLDGEVFSEPAGTLTKRGLCQNVIALGATGSGKSTFLRWILPKVIQSGGLLIAAKADDRETYERIARSVGKEVLVLDGTGPGLAFFEAAVAGVALEDRGLAAERAWDSLTAVLSREGKRQASGENAYFVLAARQFVRFAVDAMALADCPVSADNVLRVATWVPRSTDELGSDVWRKGFLARLLAAGGERAGGLGLGRFFERAEEFFTVHLPGLSDKTQGSVLSEVTAVGDVLTRGACRRLLDGRLSPAALVASGAVVIVDTPFMLQGDTGRACSAGVKFAFEQALLKRPVAADTPVWPVVCDEFQEIVTDEDAAYAAVCRSQRAPLVVATQCVNSLIDKLGTAERAQVLIGNLGNRFVFNPTPATAKWVCEELIGRDKQVVFNASAQSAPEPGQPPATSAGGGQVFELSVRPQDLFRLAQGERGVVECLWFAPGRPWGFISIKRS